MKRKRETFELDEKTLNYFDVQDKKYNKPVCTVYIDAHGDEELKMNKCTDTSTIYSMAGILGALAYADEAERDGVVMPDSRYYRKLIGKQTNTRGLKESLQHTADELKPHVARHFIPDETDDHVDKWSKQHFDKYALKPMRQMFKKTYEFIHKEEEDKKYYEFGVYIQNITYPENWPLNATQERIMKHLDKLRGVNIVSNKFVESETEFPEAIAFLKEIESTGNHRVNKERRIMDDTFISHITFEELVQLLSKLGFGYSYIFDDSCRSNKLVDKRSSPSPKTKKQLQQIAEKERKLSLKYRPSLRSKIKSTGTLKKTRVLSKQTRSESIKQMVSVKRKRFNELIISEVENVLFSFPDDYGFTIETQYITPKNIALSLSSPDYIVYNIKININFLKIVNVIINEGSDFADFDELCKNDMETYSDLKTILKQFKEGLKKLIGKTLSNLEAKAEV